MMGARQGPPVRKRPVGLWLTADTNSGRLQFLADALLDACCEFI